ncbi:MAG: 2-oxo acid dehydrogenase subunit E2 [Actinobacteria bacterium]|nr:2-oxo acid dehydrogenase subunit E2 [Actinomycetota bacterium]
MAIELKVPNLGMDMEEAGIVRWLVREGDEVEKGDPVLEIDTDKTSYEIESPADGIIRNLRGEEGETVPVGAPLAYITAPGEESPDPAEPSEVRGGSEPGEGELSIEEPARRVVKKKPEALQSENGRRVRASPAARRVAAERGLPIENVSGSGPHGRIYLSDVLEMDGGLRPPEPEIVEDAANATTEPALREPLSRIRRLGAERTARSFSEVPHFYLTRDLKADRLLELVGRLKEKMEPAPSVTALLALVVARTLKDHPRLNGRYADGKLELSPRVDAIINAPEAAILAVGRVRTVPEWRDGEWIPRLVISGTLSVDHRVADGADGARFLMDVQAALSDWELLL